MGCTNMLFQCSKKSFGNFAFFPEKVVFQSFLSRVRDMKIKIQFKIKPLWSKSQRWLIDNRWLAAPQKCTGDKKNFDMQNKDVITSFHRLHLCAFQCSKQILQTLRCLNVRLCRRVGLQELMESHIWGLKVYRPY